MTNIPVPVAHTYLLTTVVEYCHVIDTPGRHDLMHCVYSICHNNILLQHYYCLVLNVLYICIIFSEGVIMTWYLISVFMLFGLQVALNNYSGIAGILEATYAYITSFSIPL